MKSSAAIFWLRVFPASPRLLASTLTAHSSPPLIQYPALLPAGLRTVPWELLFFKNALNIALKSTPNLLQRLKPQPRPFGHEMHDLMYPAVRTRDVWRMYGLRDAFRSAPASPSPSFSLHQTQLCLHFRSPVAVPARSRGSLTLDNHLFKWKCSCTTRWPHARASCLHRVWKQKGSQPNKWPSVGRAAAARAACLTAETVTLSKEAKFCPPASCVSYYIRIKPGSEQ